ncbi:MAG TPA: PASTA domain-containing protein [Solirubrobacteraceae bacterium]|nr:PASTA domain-containing protein [Solirubrobacteraceae bacterium]
MTRHPRTLTLALAAALLAALALSAGSALARGRTATRTATVPRVSGDVNHAYVVLRRHGFKVSIARPFTLRNDAVTTVRSVSPKAGRRVRRGSVVTLTLRCCGRLAHPPRVGSADGSPVPQMRGGTLAQVAGWAQSQQRRYRAAVGPLRAGTMATLAANYVVTRQSVPAGAVLRGAAAQGLSARQGRPAACTPPYYARTVLRDSQAVVWSLSGAPGQPSGEVDYAGCTLQRNAAHRLERTNAGSTSDTALTSPALAGTRFAAISHNGPNQALAGPGTEDIFSWDLTSGQRTTLDSPGATPVDQLTVNAQGFAAWRTITSPGNTNTALSGISCPTAGFCAATDVKGSVFTSSSPTGGRGAWTQTQLPVNALTAVSCPSAGLCVVAGSGELLASINPAGGAQTWQQIAVPGSYTSIACASATLCVAVGPGVIATSSNPSSPSGWTSGSSPENALNAVSCPSSTLCAATDGNSGDVLTSTDPAGGASTWSAAKIDNRGLNGIACGSPTLCVTGDGSGDIFTAGNPSGGVTAWSLTAQGQWSPGPFACASNSLCMAGIGQGLIVATSPTGPASSWSTASLPNSLYFAGVSCAPGGGLCAAVDPSGNIATSTNPAGGTNAWSVAAVDALPCVASGGCDTEAIVAHDSSGLRTLDTTGPGNGLQLQRLTLTDDTLTWTNNGTARTATLG